MTNERSNGLSFTVSQEAFEFAQMRLSEQFRAIEGSDRKAETVVATGLAIVGLVAALTTLTAQQRTTESAVASLVAAVLILIAFGAVALFFYLGFRMQEWEFGPEDEHILTVATEHEAEQVRTWLPTWLVRSYEANKQQLNAKKRHFTRAFRALAGQTVLFLVAVAAVALVQLAG